MRVCVAMAAMPTLHADAKSGTDIGSCSGSCGGVHRTGTSMAVTLAQPHVQSLDDLVWRVILIVTGQPRSHSLTVLCSLPHRFRFLNN